MTERLASTMPIKQKESVIPEEGSLWDRAVTIKEIARFYENTEHSERTDDLHKQVERAFAVREKAFKKWMEDFPRLKDWKIFHIARENIENAVFMDMELVQAAVRHPDGRVVQAVSEKKILTGDQLALIQLRKDISAPTKKGIYESQLNLGISQARLKETEQLLTAVSELPLT